MTISGSWSVMGSMIITHSMRGGNGMLAPGSEPCRLGTSAITGRTSPPRSLPSVHGACRSCSGRGSEEVTYGVKALYRRSFVLHHQRNAARVLRPMRQRALGDRDHRPVLGSIAGLRIRRD